jgi:hypothetical protein
VELALAHPEKSPGRSPGFSPIIRAISVSDSSVYRILKGFDLIQSPVFQRVPAREKFEYCEKKTE